MAQPFVAHTTANSASVLVTGLALLLAVDTMQPLGQLQPLPRLRLKQTTTMTASIGGVSVLRVVVRGFTCTCLLISLAWTVCGDTVPIRSATRSFQLSRVVCSSRKTQQT